MNQQEKSINSMYYIIECAIDEFADKGSNVSLNNICKQNGISKGKLYHHFSSKEELLCACVCYALDNLSSDVEEFEIDNSLSIYDNLHNYYVERIKYWHENPSHLTILRLAYVLRRREFTEESMTEIAQHKQNWDNAMKSKVLQIIHLEDNKLKISDENFAELMILLYENTFQAMESKIVNAVRNNDTESASKLSHELLKHYDTIISTVLYGIFDK
ncbi:MAG: TetR/AcrR family transcriptional regulator [Eubacterium sp.]|nr:TetR/AcrR family transcriptional regulator [Eubacterium sp.]